MGSHRPPLLNSLRQQQGCWVCCASPRAGPPQRLCAAHLAPPLPACPQPERLSEEKFEMMLWRLEITNAGGWAAPSGAGVLGKAGSEGAGRCAVLWALHGSRISRKTGRGCGMVHAGVWEG